MTPPPKSFRFNDRAASIEMTTVGRPGRSILREIPVQLRACPSNARFSDRERSGARHKIVQCQFDAFL